MDTSLNTNFETSLAMFCRIRQQCNSLSIDQDIFNSITKISIIDSQSSHPLAMRAFLFHLILQSLDDPVQESLRKNVLIIDGNYFFDQNDFVQIINNQSMTNIQYYRFLNENTILCYLYDDLLTQMTINSHLKLIVIVCLPYDLFPDSIYKINEYLFSLPISVPILLVVDHLNTKLINIYKEKPSCQMLTIQNNNIDNDFIKENDQIKLKIMVTKNENYVKIPKKIEIPIQSE